MILNIFDQNVRSIVNTLGLILKQLIYRCKCQNTKVSMPMYRNEVELYERYKYYYAKQSDKVGFHNNIWKIKYQTCEFNITEYISRYIDKM